MNGEAVKVPVEYLIITTSDWTLFEVMPGGRWQNLQVEYVEGKDRLTREVATSEKSIRLDKALGDSSLVVVNVKATLNLEKALRGSVLKYRISKGDMQSTKVIVTGRAGKTVSFFNNGKISGSELNTRIYSSPAGVYLPDLTSEKLLIVHGKDVYQALRLNEFLSNHNVESVMLDDLADQGKTLAEKARYIQDNVSYAFAILTPDDVGCLKKNVDKATTEQLATSKETLSKLRELLQSRARQDVLFEAGLLMGFLGKENVCLLKQKSVKELPADLDGGFCKEFEVNVDEKFLEIQCELGLSSDLGKPADATP